MGVAGLWDILRPAGKMRSLTHLSVKDGFEANPDGKRGFRVGIDASIWFYHATYGREGENPELRTLFFRCTRLMSMPFLPLFVFDGPKRPEVKRGKRISGKNHWMVQGMQEIITAFGFEWRMAPGEAEAELAYLNRIGVIDAVLSDDVDTFLFGATMVVRNPSTSLSGNNAHSLKNSAGKDDGNHVMTYALADFLTREDIQLDQEGLILVGVLRGGDYSSGLHGCGVTTAVGLAKAGFGHKLVRAARTLSREALEDYLVEWREELRKELRSNPSGCLTRKSPTLAKAIPEDFPDIDVLLSYTNPITSEAKGRGHKNTVVDWDKEPDLGRIAGLCEMYFEWGIKHIIIKRFRTVLWPSAVLRIVRRGALIKDKKAALGARAGSARNPETPRKNGKERQTAPGTPSRMITKHFAKYTSPRKSGVSGDDSDDEDEDGETLLVKIHSSRRHATTDNILEYRLEVAPAQLVRLCEAGIRGLRTALPPDLSDSDEESDSDEGSGKKGKKAGKAPPDPESHLRIWLPASMIEIVEPALVEEFEGVQQRKAEKKASKGAKGKKADAASNPKSSQASAVSIDEEESESGRDRPATKAKSTKVLPTSSSTASKKQTKSASASTAGAPTAGSSKIHNHFRAKKTTSVAATKANKATSKSSVSRVAELFKDPPSLSTRPPVYEEEESSDDEPVRPSQLLRMSSSHAASSSQATSHSQATSYSQASSSSSIPYPSASAISARSSGSSSLSQSSRILSFLDGQSTQHAPRASSKPSAPSPPKPRVIQPFPMAFDIPMDDEPLDIVPTEDDFFTNNKPSPHSSPGRARPRSSLTSSSETELPSQGLNKSPRRSKKQSSPRSTPSKAKSHRNPHREEQEESSDDETFSRPASPSPVKGPSSTRRSLGSSNVVNILSSPRTAHSRQHEKEVPERAPSPSPPRRKPAPFPLSDIDMLPADTPRRTFIRKPQPLSTTDRSIIVISSDDESEIAPPLLRAQSRVAPPKASQNVRPTTTTHASAFVPPKARAVAKKTDYDPTDVIDLT